MYLRAGLWNTTALFYNNVLLEESFSQLTHRIAFCFPYSAVGKVPGDTEHIFDYIFKESNRLQARRYWSRMMRMIYQRAWSFLGVSGSILFTLLFVPTVGLSIKARVLRRYEQARGLEVSFQGINSLLLIDKVIRLSNPLWDRQLNGAHSQAVHLSYFFHPLSLRRVD